jgi:hypothetical protein
MKEGERIAIPCTGDLRHQLCREHHDTPLGGLFGREKTYLALHNGGAVLGLIFITKLPTTSEGHDCIVSIIDHLTKRVHFLPLTEKGLTAETFSKLFYEFYIRLHGVPDVIVSDQDANFLGDF